MRDGARSEPQRLFARLDRLGYRRVEGIPAKGEYRWSPPELNVFLRGYRSPVSGQDEGAYTLRRDDSGAWQLKDGLGGALAELRLEPELAAQLPQRCTTRSSPRRTSASGRIGASIREGSCRDGFEPHRSYLGLDAPGRPAYPRGH